MNATEWVLTLILGGILGMIGQSIRMVMGLKKASDEASVKGQKLGDMFEGSRLILTLLIGFIAGALAIIGLSGTIDLKAFTSENIVTLIGAGYAGTDFIEGFVKKSIPAAQANKPEVVEQGETEQPAVG